MSFLCYSGIWWRILVRGFEKSFLHRCQEGSSIAARHWTKGFCSINVLKSLLYTVNL